MRRILIDYARKKKRIKRGGDAKRVQLTDITLAEKTETEELLALDAALSELELLDKQKADLVKLRFFRRNEAIRSCPDSEYPRQKQPIVIGPTRELGCSAM